MEGVFHQDCPGVRAGFPEGRVHALVVEGKLELSGMSREADSEHYMQSVQPECLVHPGDSQRHTEAGPQDGRPKGQG